MDVKSLARCRLLIGSLVSCIDSGDGGFGCLWMMFLLLGCWLLPSTRNRKGMANVKARNEKTGDDLLNLVQTLSGRVISEPEEKKDVNVTAPTCSYDIQLTSRGRLFCLPESHCSEVKGPNCSCSRSHGESAGGKILLVEDTEINRMLLRRLFKELNLLFEEAENGQIAVEYFKQGKNYDLVLMDKEMPVMDGHEATRRIRHLGVKTPIVALTGNSLQSDKDMFFQAGASDFRTKPLSRDELILLVARYVA